MPASKLTISFKSNQSEYILDNMGSFQHHSETALTIYFIKYSIQIQ